MVSVLVLINEDMPEAAAILLAELGKAWNKCTVVMIRSSKSSALASAAADIPGTPRRSSPRWTSAPGRPPIHDRRARSCKPTPNS